MVLFLLLIGVASYFVGSSASGHSRRAKRRQLFERIAKQFGGKCERGGWFTAPSTSIRYGQTWAIVSQGKAAEPSWGPCFVVCVGWNNPQRCDVVSRPDIWPGIVLSADFEREFAVVAGDDARHILSDGVKWQIQRLASLGPDQRLHVTIGNGRIVAKKPWRAPTTGDALLSFVQGTLELHDQLMLATATGIEFLNGNEAQPLVRIVCKVCGDEIREELVFCQRCKTPHHHDCWQYTGVCSVFGCREQTFLVPHPGQTTMPKPTDVRMNSKLD